jgi:NAD(P)-dependent dehydrogenase (short-subunit alcohol dehydrogenase family)
MSLLDGKTVIVSGVGRGLGRQVALAARREGANVVLAARTEANLREVADEVDASGQSVAVVPTDICDEARCQRLVDASQERFGQLDAVVNVAAYDSALGGLLDSAWDDWRRTFEVNVLGAMQLTKAAVPALEMRGGAVVFIGSQSMYGSPVPQAAYAASKAALTGAVAHLARELGQRRIRVNVVVPSWMWGPAVQGYVESMARGQGIPADDIVAGIAGQIPLGEIVPDADVADAAVFLASDRARSITGQSLLVNGGEYLR